MSELLLFKGICVILVALLLLGMAAYLDCLSMARKYKRLYLQEPRVHQEEKGGRAFRFLNLLLTLKSTL